MSDQSQFYNPQLDRMALTGAGFILPRLTTAQRLGLSVGANDAGLQLFDTTAGTIYLWTGTAWTSVGGGGGSRRILATTLTYTGAPGTWANEITPAVTGTLPNPATVLPSGVLQSVEYVSRSLLDHSMFLSCTDPGINWTVQIPVFLKFGCGGAGNMDAMSFIAASFLTSSAGATVSRNLNSTNRVLNSTTTYGAASISSWGFTPFVSLSVSQPLCSDLYYFGAPVVDTLTISSLQLDGTIEVYYLFG